MLKRLIAEEMNYFNTLLAGVAGPLRTMPETIQDMTGRWEALFGEVAALGSHPRDQNNLPKTLAPYADLLGSTDMRKRLLLDLAASPGAVLAPVRRTMAIEMLRYAREQSAAFSSTLVRADQVLPFAVQTLSAHDSRTKRNLQLPASALVQETTDDRLTVTLPWGIRFTIPAPNRPWNSLILRDDGDNRWTVELSTGGYQIRRQDAAGFGDKRKGKGGAKGRRPVAGRS